MAFEAQSNSTFAPLTVGVGQFRPTHNSSENLRVIAEYAARAASEGCELVVFPEYSHAFQADRNQDWIDRAEPLDGNFVSELARISQEHGGISIVAGMLEAPAAPGGKPRNTIVVVDEQGLAHHSRKIHLYDAFGFLESEILDPAPLSPITVWNCRNWAVGVQTCYDIRFPEVSRALLDAGAIVVVVPSQWVPGPSKIDHWRTLLTARAIETQTFVVAANQPRPSGVGHSMVVDPFGDIALELGDDEGFAAVTLDPEILIEVRKKNPMISARRFSVSWDR